MTVPLHMQRISITQALSNNNQGYLKLLNVISIKAQQPQPSVKAKHKVVQDNTIKTEERVDTTINAELK